MGGHRPTAVKRRPAPKPCAGGSQARQRWLKRHGVPVTQSRAAAEEDSDDEYTASPTASPAYAGTGGPARIPVPPCAAEAPHSSEGADGPDGNDGDRDAAARLRGPPPPPPPRPTLHERMKQQRRELVAEWQATREVVELVSNSMEMQRTVAAGGSSPSQSGAGDPMGDASTAAASASPTHSPLRSSAAGSPRGVGRMDDTTGEPPSSLYASTLNETSRTGAGGAGGRKKPKQWAQGHPCDYHSVRDAYAELGITATAGWFAAMFLWRSGLSDAACTRPPPEEVQVYPTGFPCAVKAVMAARDVVAANEERARVEREATHPVRRVPPETHPVAHLPASAFPQREFISLAAGFHEGQLTYWTQRDAEPHACTPLCTDPYTGKPACPPPRAEMQLWVDGRDAAARAGNIFTWPVASLTRAGRGGELPLCHYPPFTFSLATGNELLPMEVASAGGAFSVVPRGEMKIPRNLSEVSYIGTCGVGIEVVHPSTYIPPAYSLGRLTDRAAEAALLRGAGGRASPDDLAAYMSRYTTPDLYGPGYEALMATRSNVVSRATVGEGVNDVVDAAAAAVADTAAPQPDAADPPGLLEQGEGSGGAANLRAGGYGGVGPSGGGISPAPPSTRGGGSASRPTSRASLVHQYRNTPHPFTTTKWPRGKAATHVVVFSAKTVEKYTPFPRLEVEEEKLDARERRRQERQAKREARMRARKEEEEQRQRELVRRRRREEGLDTDDDDGGSPRGAGEEAQAAAEEKESEAPCGPDAPDGVVRLTDGAHNVAWPCLSFNSDQLAWVQWDPNTDLSDGALLHVAAYDAERSQLINTAAVIDGSCEATVHSPGFLQSGELVYLCDAACGTFRLYVTTYDPLANRHTGTTGLLDIGVIRHKVDSAHRVLAVMKYSNWSQVAVITSHDGCDSVVLYDTATKEVLRVCKELVGVGLTRLWNIQSMDESRVAMFACGPATAATVVVYDMRYGRVKSLCDGSGIGLTRPPPLAAVAMRVAENAWVFLPPRGVIPDIPAECGEYPVEGRYPLILQPHSGFYDDWTPDAYDPATQFFASHGFAVVHTLVSGGARRGRDRRQQGIGTWFTRGAEEVVHSMHAVNAVVPVDFHHIAVRGASLDAFLALHSTAAQGSLARAAVLSSFTPNLHQWKGEHGTLGFPSSLFSTSDAISVAGLRVPMQLHHSRDDVVQPLAEVASFVKLLECTPTYHGGATLRVVDGAAHPPHWRDTVESELAFLTTAQWDPMEDYA